MPTQMCSLLVAIRQDIIAVYALSSEAALQFCNGTHNWFAFSLEVGSPFLLRPCLTAESVTTDSPCGTSIRIVPQYISFFLSGGSLDYTIRYPYSDLLPTGVKLFRCYYFLFLFAQLLAKSFGFSLYYIRILEIIGIT